MTTLQPSPSSFGQTGGSPSSPGDDWQQLADTADIDEEGLKEVYVAALEECKYDSAELESVHTLAEKAQQMLNPRFVILQRTTSSLHPSFLLTPLHQLPISLQCSLILCLPPPSLSSLLSLPSLPPFPPFPPFFPPSLPYLPPLPPSLTSLPFLPSLPPLPPFPSSLTSLHPSLPPSSGPPR